MNEKPNPTALKRARIELSAIVARMELLEVASETGSIVSDSYSAIENDLTNIGSDVRVFSGRGMR